MVYWVLASERRKHVDFVSVVHTVFFGKKTRNFQELKSFFKEFFSPIT